MQTIKIVVWQDDDTRLGYVQEFPDYWTQAIASSMTLRDAWKTSTRTFREG